MKWPSAIGDDNYSLALPFYHHALTQPNATALFVNDYEYSYSALAKCAQRLAKQILSHTAKRDGLRVGIFASQNAEAYIGILATCWAGCTYVAINPKWPAGRLEAFFAKARLSLVVTDQAGIEVLSQGSLAGKPETILKIDPAIPEDEKLEKPNTLAAEAIAYIMFTSGSTGVPKGVMIEAQSVRLYVGILQDLYHLTQADRVGQFSELSFDFSVLDLFMTWNGGAALYCVPAKFRLIPTEFIRKQKLTIWASVPSVINMMKSHGHLQPNCFADLRVAIFCGEPLTTQVVDIMHSVAPRCRVENHYGPTEATVSCSVHSVVGKPKTTLNRDVVSIGRPFDQCWLAVLDEDEKTFLPSNRNGQLCIAGVQVANGYFQDEAQTASRFRTLVHPEFGSKRWYLTGDVAFFDEAGDFHHLGRSDNQVKIRGHRVDLEDVESHLRKIAGTDQIAAVAWPKTNEGANGIVAFVANSELPEHAILEHLRAQLPAYMVPKTIRKLEILPLNTNGKIDRKKLLELLENVAS